MLIPRSLDRHQIASCQPASGTPLIDTLKQRVRILEVENRRLMANQGQLVGETNRRVEVTFLLLNLIFLAKVFY